MRLETTDTKTITRIHRVDQIVCLFWFEIILVQLLTMKNIWKVHNNVHLWLWRFRSFILTLSLWSCSSNHFLYNELLLVIIQKIILWWFLLSLSVKLRLFLLYSTFLNIGYYHKIALFHSFCLKLNHLLVILSGDSFFIIS